MKDARIYVNFSELLEEDLIPLSNEKYVEDSQGNVIELSEDLHVKLYSDDWGGCGEKDNLIADGIVEINSVFSGRNEVKWNCRINKAGIYNESQKDN